MVSWKLRLSQMLEISSHGHILYIYDSPESYVENAVSYILLGIEQGDHILMIENQAIYERIYSRVQDLLPEEKLKQIYYVDNEIYYSNGDSRYENVIQYINNLLLPIANHHISIRSWSNVLCDKQVRDFNDIEQSERMADQIVNSAELISVCAYDGSRIPASFHIRLMRNHQFFMTDKELVKSSLYEKSTPILQTMSMQHEHTRMAVQLKATQHQLKSFIMENLDPIVMLDKNDLVIAINRAYENTFGWAAEEVLGLHAVEMPVIPSDRKFEVKRNASFTKSGEKINGYETLRITKDGQLLNIMLSSFPLYDENQQVNGWTVIARDITETKQSQELLIRTEKLSMAGELAAGIAHEIRNPVTAIKGFLQLLQAGFEDTETYYEIMSSEIGRIELILNELLILAKPQASHFQKQNISLLLQDVVTLLNPQANLNNVQIKLELESEETYLICEENQMKQVCINFIKNAIEAMKDGGILSIETQNIDNQKLLIRFIDEGSGIPKHLLAKLGLPFWTTKEKGTGLGFMVSKKIIEDHNGSVFISSVENKGTTIEVTLPM